MPARAWGFKSPLRHHLTSAKALASAVFGGGSSVGLDGSGPAKRPAAVVQLGRRQPWALVVAQNPPPGCSPDVDVRGSPEDAGAGFGVAGAAFSPWWRYGQTDPVALAGVDRYRIDVQ